MSRLYHLTSFSPKPNRGSYYVACGVFRKPFLKNPDIPTSCWWKSWHIQDSKTCGIVWDVPINNIFPPRNNNKQIMIFWRSTRLLKNVFVYILCVILLSVWNVHVVSLSLDRPRTSHNRALLRRREQFGGITLIWSKSSSLTPTRGVFLICATFIRPFRITDYRSPIAHPP